MPIINYYRILVYESFSFRRAVDVGRDRVECTIVGPIDPQDQSLSPDRFLDQIITVLRGNNFTIEGTEATSGIIHTNQCFVLHNYYYVYQHWDTAVMKQLKKA